MSDEMASQALIQDALQRSAQSLELRNPDSTDETSPTAGFPRFRPQPPRISIEELRRGRSQAPSPPSQVDTLTAQVAQLTALVNQLAAPGTTTPPPPDLTPERPIKEQIRGTLVTSPPVKRKAGRPVGTTKVQIAAQKEARMVADQLARDQAALKVPLPPRPKASPTPGNQKSASCLVSAIPLPTTADRSAVVQAIEALPHGLFNALLAEVNHQLSVNDSYKLFRKIVRRTGTWEPDRMPPWMLEQVALRMDHLLTNKQFIRQVVAGCLCIEPATAGSKVHYWLVNLAGWLAWASVTEAL